MIYYNKKKEIVRDSIPQDIEHIAKNMRQKDIDEIWASHHIEPRPALERGYAQSIKCLSVIKNRKPISMFGIVPYDILGRFAAVWFLATDDLTMVSYKFVRHSREFINIFLELYPILCNYVDARNIVSINWLKLCGAQIGNCVPYGVEKMSFHPFTIRR